MPGEAFTQAVLACAPADRLAREPRPRGSSAPRWARGLAALRRALLGGPRTRRGVLPDARGAAWREGREGAPRTATPRGRERASPRGRRGDLSVPSTVDTVRCTDRRARVHGRRQHGVDRLGAADHGKTVGSRALRGSEGGCATEEERGARVARVDGGDGDWTHRFHLGVLSRVRGRAVSTRGAAKAVGRRERRCAPRPIVGPRVGRVILGAMLDPHRYVKANGLPLRVRRRGPRGRSCSSSTGSPTPPTHLGPRSFDSSPRKATALSARSCGATSVSRDPERRHRRDHPRDGHDQARGSAWGEERHRDRARLGRRRGLWSEAALLA